MSYNNLLVFGSIAKDEIMNFPKVIGDFFDPNKLHQINVSFVVDKLDVQLGGTATNISYNFRLLSKQNCEVLGSVGRDGDPFLQFFASQNLGQKYLTQNDELYTSTGKVITDIKDNQIWGFYYGAAIDSKNIKLSSDNKHDLLIISPNHPEGFLSVLNQAIQLGIDYMFDPGMALTFLSDEDLKKGVLDSKWTIGNDYEMAQITKRISLNEAELVDQGVAVITTLGAEGVIYQDKNQKITLPAIKLDKVVDPTGAGDSFRGAFLAGIMEKKSILDSLKQGIALSSFVVESKGGINHKPTSTQIKQRLAQI
jgi:adenosine kinase